MFEKNKNRGTHIKKAAVKGMLCTLVAMLFMLSLITTVSADATPKYVKTIGGPSLDSGSSVTQTSDGNFVMTGSWDYYAGKSHSDLFLIKVDNNGDRILGWGTILSGSTTNDRYDTGSSVIEASNGDLVVVGHSTSFGSDFNAIIARFSSDGRTLGWASILDPPPGVESFGLSVTETSDGDFVMTGAIWGYTAGNDMDLFIGKFNGGTGALMGSGQVVGQVGKECGTSVIEKGNDLFVTGWTTSFDGPDADILLAKFDKDLEFQWAKAYGESGSSDYGNSVIESGGNLFVTGSTWSFGVVGSDLFLAKFNDAGSSQGITTLGGANDEAGNSLVDSDDGIVVTGYTESFGAGKEDLLLAKFDYNGGFEWARDVTGPSQNLGGENEVGRSVIPVPNGLVVAGSTNSWGIGEDILLARFDLDGKTVSGCYNVIEPTPSKNPLPFINGFNPLTDVKTISACKDIEADTSISPITPTVTPICEEIWPMFRHDAPHTGLSPFSGYMGGKNVRRVWSYGAGGPVCSSPALGDINGDGKLDVVFGSHDGKVYALNREGSFLWSRKTNHWVQSSPALGDIDNDGEVEVIVGSEDGNIYVLNGDDGSEKFPPRSTGDKVHSSPVLGDIDNDGVLEAVVCSENGKVYKINKDGCFPLMCNIGSSVRSSPALGDIDNDGDLDGVVGADDGCVYEIDFLFETCDQIYCTSTREPIYSSPALGDIDGDGNLEVVVGSEDNCVYAINPGSGTLVWSSPYCTGWKIHSSPALGDIDGDGNLEVVVGSEDNKVYALNGGNGGLLWSYQTGGNVHSSPALGDVDGDGKLEVVVGSWDNYIYALNGDGGGADRLLWKYPTGGGIMSSPAISQGKPCHKAMIFVGSDDGKLYALGPEICPKWHQDMSSFPEPNSNQVMMTPIVADVTGDRNVPDGVPDIIFTTFDPALTPSEYIRHGIIRVLDGKTGSMWFSTGYIRTPNWGVVPIASVAVADLDNDGNPEIIAILDDREGTINNNLICFSGQDGNLKWFGGGSGLPPEVVCGGPTIANIGVDGFPPHIIVGNFVWNRGGAVVGTYPYNPCGTGRYLSCVADLDGDSLPEVIAGNCVFGSGSCGWWRSDLPDGFNAIANFDKLGNPEVVLVGNGNVYVLDGLTGTTRCSVSIPGDGGGPPCIADFDGDGVPEIGVAGDSKYVVIDAWTGTWTCTPMWDVDIQDKSSGVASSSACDFDGDGAYEIAYSDELYFYIFDGGTGTVLFQTGRGECPSFTGCENPVIANVDNEWHTEIVVPCNNYVKSGDTGIKVYGSPRWPWARGIWNQHTYHITNIEDDATVPFSEENNWLRFNNYRTQDCRYPCLVDTATGTGTAYFMTDSGSIQNLTAVPEGILPSEGKPIDLQFPHGFFSFNITGLTNGTTVNVTIILPGDMPTTTQYWKCHTPEGWYQISMGSNDGDNIITIQLNDGGLGDDDGVANGVIVDAGGPGVLPPVEVPAITPLSFLLALLSLLGLGAIAMRRMYKRR